MDRMSPKQLERLGAMVRAATERTMETGAAAREARQRFLQAAKDDGVRRTRQVRGWTLASATCAAIVIAVVTLTSRDPSQTTFAIGEPPIAGKVGEWLAASEAPVPVRFSDGSALEMEPGTKLRVTATTAEGADVLIESGTLHASIEHRSARTRWMVHAGPFEVRVTGTRFDASWDPRVETLRVAVKEGSVTVSGPQLPPERGVVAGEFLIVAVRTSYMTLGKGDGLDAADGANQSPAGTAGAGHRTDGAGGAEADEVGPTQEMARKGNGDTAANVGRGGATAAADSGSGGRHPGSAWRELARSRQYREAWATIEQLGFEQELSRAGASDLLTMADVARFAGQPGRAKQALMRMRERFGASGQSAFLLGRLAADQLGAAGEAVVWFETYLREQPNGPLAEQALGRILDLQRRGSPDRARPVAERYLARYPNGAYAAVARSVLQP